MQEIKKYPFLSLAAANEPYMDQLRAAAWRVIDSGRYIGGAEVEELESELAAMTGVPFAIGVSNGLDALRLTLRAWIQLGKLNPGDEVIVPANTYIASVLAIVDAGLTPVLAEPAEDTMNLDTERLGEYLTPRTRAIMPVHLYGRVCWDADLASFVKARDLLVIEDCAQAIGARSRIDGLFGTQQAGGLGHAAALSFYPTKNVGALGDGGAVLTHSRELADAVRTLANYGSDRRYHNIYAGYNCRLDPVQAAMLRVKLPHTAEENADRFARALAYVRTIDHPLVSVPAVPDDVVSHVWHQFVIRVGSGKRDEMQRRLAAEGVGTDIHYAVPPHLQPCFRGKLAVPGSLPVTERIAGEILSLPIGRGTSVKDAADIARIINRIDL